MQLSLSRMSQFSRDDVRPPIITFWSSNPAQNHLFLNATDVVRVRTAEIEIRQAVSALWRLGKWKCFCQIPWCAEPFARSYLLAQFSPPPPAYQQKTRFRMEIEFIPLRLERSSSFIRISTTRVWCIFPLILSTRLFLPHTHFYTSSGLSGQRIQSCVVELTMKSIFICAIMITQLNCWANCVNAIFRPHHHEKRRRRRPRAGLRRYIHFFAVFFLFFPEQPDDDASRKMAAKFDASNTLGVKLGKI